MPYPRDYCKVIESYSSDEINGILNAINLEIDFWNKGIDKSYVKTGVGQNPKFRISKRNPDWNKFGWKNFENCVWYFENVMNCDASSQARLQHPFFYSSIAKFDGREGFFRRLGIVRTVYLENLGPLVLKLAYLTGLNPTSIFDLKEDCLVDSDIITNGPSLRYNKNRSGGSMNYSISTFDENETVRDLKQKQYLQIKRVVDQIKELTSLIRNDAPEELKNRLLIYWSRSPKKFGRITSIRSSCLSLYCHHLVKKYNLKDSSGELLELNLRRFRSTRLNLMSL
jgi:hypothetical protein